MTTIIALLILWIMTIYYLIKFILKFKRLKYDYDKLLNQHHHTWTISRITWDTSENIILSYELVCMGCKQIRTSMIKRYTEHIKSATYTLGANNIPSSTSKEHLKLIK